MNSFLYSFANFFQPGVFWPELAPYKPMVIVSILAGIAAMRGGAVFSRSAQFSSKPFRYMIIFLVIQIISVFAYGFGAMLNEFNFWYAYAIYVVVIMLLVRDEKSLNQVVWGTITGGMFIVGYGIYAVIEGLTLSTGGRAGAYGMYENHNDYSFAILLILPFIYMLWRDERGFKRLILASFLVTCVIGILFSLSRGGMLVLVLEGFLFVMMGYEGKQKFLLMMIMVGIGLAGIAYQWAKREENQGTIYTAEDAKTSRYELWKIGGNMIASHPLFGIGSRRFSEYAKDYGELSGDNRGKNSHNTYIEILAGNGIVGFTVFVLFARNLLRQVKIARTLSESSRLNSIATAVYIATISILVRAFLDAKIHDWSFYTLCALGVSVVALIQVTQRQDPSAARSV